MKIARQKSEKLAVILKVANIWDMLVACQHRFDCDEVGYVWEALRGRGWRSWEESC
jgi:hypothetical protein